MFSAVNPFYAVIYDADGAANIRALDVTGLVAGTKVAVRDGDSFCDWVLVWAPGSLLDDNESLGIIRPNSVAVGDPGRWTWTGEYVWQNTKGIDGVAVSASRDLVLSDIGRCLEVDAGATDVVLTVPTNVLFAAPLYSVIHVLRKGSGAVSVDTVGGSGVVIQRDASRGLSVGAQWGYGMLRKIGTDTWTWSGHIS